MLKKLAIITTHPIQYNAPMFAMLTKRSNISVKVFYTWGEEVLKNKYDPGFGKAIKWDVPLLQGYDYTTVNNVAKKTGSDHFYGIDNPTLIDEIKQWNAEAILVYGWSFKSHLKVIQYFHGKIPVLFRGDSTWLQKKSRLKETLRKVFLKWVYNNVDVAFFVGTHNKDYYKKVGLLEHQLVFAPHAIDNYRFQQQSSESKEEVCEWKKRLGIQNGDIVFLYAGKLDRNKNVGLLLKAFKQLADEQIHLIIAGNGESESELKSKYEKIKGVHFIPFQNQLKMPLLYSIADIFVLPSLSETWGLSINEAMACGCAILASSGCGAAIDLVSDQTNGFIFFNNDLNDLKVKMALLINNRNEIINYGNSSKMIINNWNFEKVCVTIEETLKSVLAKNE